MGGRRMLYEIFWLFYALGVAILVSIGLWGIFSLRSIPAPRPRVMALALSVIIMLVGPYLSYQLNLGKKGESEYSLSRSMKLSNNT
jgi:hypothetical protein